MKCPCCSGNEYRKCCEIFHDGALPKHALELMRSRYTAYALNIPDYIIATTHPKNPHYSSDHLSWKREISEFSKNFTFHKLEITDSEEKGLAATVTFTAHISQPSCDATFTEKSAFEKVKGKWLYLGAQLIKNH